MKQNHLIYGMLALGVVLSCSRVEQPDMGDPSPELQGYEAVDLGLSVKWATCNIGAKSPEEYGDYFAWGETEPYYEPGYAQSDDPVWKSGKENGYEWPSYKWSNGSYTLTRYNTKSDYGTVDNKTEFADYGYEDDAARANWGGSWRTPTYEEWGELLESCTWTWQTNYNGTGKNGYLVTSNKSGYTNKSIFLPAAGHRNETYLNGAGSYGSYWSSSLNPVSPGLAWYVFFNSGGVYRGDFGRCDGQSVRPVSE